VNGTITVDEESVGQPVEVEIDAASIDTRQEDRDTHLRSGTSWTRRTIRI
jgi:polyisoprenoid-binding protein YceI